MNAEQTIVLDIYVNDGLIAVYNSEQIQDALAFLPNNLKRTLEI